MRKILKGLALVVVGALAALTMTGAAYAQKKTLVVALNQDPDILDPTLARTYVGRIVFSQMCEKLYEIDEGLHIHPQLAAALPTISDGGRTITIKLRSGVKFNDGTPMDAESVRFSLERHRTLKGSNRASELAPVCVGPWQFAERVAQDRIVVEKSPHYFEPSQAKFDKIVFRIIPDDNVRLANLKSGDIDVMHQVSPTDATAIKREGRFELSNVTGLGYDGITINLRNKTGKLNPPGDLGTPLANDPRVREALELSIDREALNQVAWDGLYTPGCTPIPPISVFYDKSRKCPARDVAKAKKLLADAGLAGGYSFELVVVNNPRSRRVGEVIQQMAREAGFNIALRAQEFASALTDNEDGKHAAFQIGWSGRVDPDGNIHQIQTCKGSLNSTGACDEKIDAILNKAREVSDVDQRRGLYREAIDLFTARRNIIYLYYPNSIVAFPKNLKGYKAVPDGLIRIKGTSWN